MTDVARVSISRRIRARPQEIFAVLADPNRHAEIDGSGMVREAIGAVPVSGVGDVFAMKMYYEEFGDYEMNNTVVEYDPGRLIAWEPTRRDVDEDAWHHRWRYELAATEEGVTVVTETFDLSGSPAEAWGATEDGSMWIPAMTATLERLEHVCTPAEAH